VKDFATDLFFDAAAFTIALVIVACVAYSGVRAIEVMF